MNKKIVLFGAQGMLGSELFNYAIEHSLSYTIIPFARFHVDLTNVQSIIDALDSQNPDMVVNMAAFTNVDRAEDERFTKEAMVVNATAPEAMASWCAKKNIPFFHVSTDYVFSGDKINDVFSESSPINPCNYYGETKAEGEKNIGGYPTSHIIRTSWLVGDGHNFVSQMIHLLKNESSVEIIDPQVGTLTFTTDFIPAFFQYIQSNTPQKIVHIINEGVVSRLEIVQEIQKFLNTNVEIIPTNSDDRLAKRPVSSALSNSLLEKLPDWKSSLHAFLLPEKNKLDAKRRKHRKV